MSKTNEQALKIKKITARVDRSFTEQMASAMAELGMQSKAVFIRVSIAEKVNAVLAKKTSKRGRLTKR